MADVPPQSTRERLAGLAAFADVFASPQFVSATPRRQGVGFFSKRALSEAVHSFIEAMYSLGWVRCDFDWSAWAHGPDGQRLVNEPAAMNSADADDLARLVTAHVRAERFVEGHLIAEFERGHMLAIAQRARALLAEQWPDDPAARPGDPAAAATKFAEAARQREDATRRLLGGDPESWPIKFILPMARPWGPGIGPECGLIFADRTTELVLCLLSDFERAASEGDSYATVFARTRAHWPCITYDSIDAMIADGWVVD